MNKYTLEEGISIIVKNGGYWHSLLEKNNFEFGVLRLAPGQEDTQSPHKSDEVYFIVSGNGKFTVGENTFEVSANSIFYVPEGMAHKFHNNTEEIVAFYVLN